jgi:hypothetical protein
MAGLDPRRHLSSRKARSDPPEPDDALGSVLPSHLAPVTPSQLEQFRGEVTAHFEAIRLQKNGSMKFRLIRYSFACGAQP